jgi:hypothetical protein
MDYTTGEKHGNLFNLTNGGNTMTDKELRDKVIRKFNYCSSKGELRRKVGGWPMLSSIVIEKKTYPISHLIFLIEFGWLPKRLYHLNNNKQDNRIQNLMELTRAEVEKLPNLSEITSADCEKLRNLSELTSAEHERLANLVWMISVKVSKVKKLGILKIMTPKGH